LRKDPPGDGRPLNNPTGGWPIFFASHHSHGGCPILAFFARACPELAEAVGEAADATLASSTTIVYAVVVRALR
jgi:hypothetical protein